MQPTGMSANDRDVLARTRELAAQERRITTEILWHLREIERRQIHAQLGFPSLFEFCVAELKYSRGAASRRIRAMRLLKEVNEMEDSLRSGEISLTTASQVQSFLQREKRRHKLYSHEEKREILNSVHGLSKEETERFLLTVSPDSAMPRETSRSITPEITELKLHVPAELASKLERLRGLLAHKHPFLSHGHLLDILAEIALDKLDPLRRASRLRKATLAQTDSSDATAAPGPDADTRVPIPAGLRREVWTRDLGRCTYVSPETGRRCESTHALEVDHERPVALGGTNAPENLRLLCRTHNQLAAVESLGRDRMTPFVESLE